MFHLLEHLQVIAVYNDPRLILFAFSKFTIPETLNVIFLEFSN